MDDKRATSKETAETECLACKRPREEVAGQLYKGNGKNGMMVKFYMCHECAASLTAPAA